MREKSQPHYIDGRNVTGVLFSPRPDTDCMELVTDCGFWADGLRVWIPRGYRWNGASIPWHLWSIIGGRFEPDRLSASLCHDWLYLVHSVQRKYADALFNHDLKATGVPDWKRGLMYQGVRAFGGKHWPTSEEDEKTLLYVRGLLAEREDRDKFTRTMLVG